MKYAFHPSFQVGRNAVYHFNPFVSFGLGTFFSTEGVGFKLDGVSPDTRLEQRMNYIRVPVFTNITFGAPKSRLRGRLGLGGSVGFLVGGKSFVETDHNFISGRKTRKLINSKVDAGAIASLGLSVRVADGLLLNHDLNYYHGFVKNEYEVGISGVSSSFTHRNLGLSMGFLINGKAIKKWKSSMGSKSSKRNR